LSGCGVAFGVVCGCFAWFDGFDRVSGCDFCLVSALAYFISSFFGTKN
jgi:hypothetical protein